MNAWRALKTSGLILGLSLWSGCGPTASPPPPPDDTLKAGFIYVGPIGDYGWSKSHEDGRQYLENFGTKVSTTYAESVAPDQAGAKIDELVASGHKLIFTTSYDFLGAARDATSRHKDVTLLNCSGFKTGERLGSYQARIEEAEYLSGMVAGAMTRNNKIGVVGALKIYEQLMHINAFTRGVQAVNPNAQVIVRWIGHWFDPSKEVAAANELVSEGGVDVVKSFTDTNIPIKTVDALNTPGRTVYTVAHANKDGCSVAPKTCLVSAYYNWGPMYVKLVEEVRTKQYPAGGRIDYVSIADEDSAGISNFADAVPQAVRDQVLARRKDIVDRKFNPFTGPFEFADGTKVESGRTLTDQELICTSKFVKGISELPGPNCSVDADCKHGILPFNNMTCTGNKCVAKDFSGCPQ